MTHSKSGNHQGSIKLSYSLLVIFTCLGLVQWGLPYGSSNAVIFTLASLLSTVLIFVALLRRQFIYNRASWYLIAWAMLITVIGNSIWYINDLTGFPHYQLLANSFYMLAYLLVMLGLWLYGRYFRHDGGVLVDALMMAIAAGVLCWAVFIVPFAGVPTLNPVELLLASAYPVADILILTFVLKIVFLSRQRPASLVMLLSAVIILLLADVIHAHGVTAGWYQPGGMLDMLWFWVYGLLAAAIWHPAATERLHEQTAETAGTVIRFWFFGLSTISVPAMLLLIAGSQPRLLQAGIITSIVLFVLMLYRMAGLLHQTRQQSSELEQMVRTDPLTGAANRRFLEERLQLEIERSNRTGNTLMVAFLDLDFFKRFNDTYGHAAGDDLLIKLVKRWQRTIRKTDLLARIGGEEFVLVCPDTDPDKIWSTVERLRALVPAGQTCSAGIALYQPHHTAEDLLASADEALYQAKAQGRDRAIWASDNGAEPKLQPA